MKRIFVLAIFALAAVLQAHASSVNLTWSEGTTTVPYAFNLYRTTTSGTACPTFATTGTGAWTQLMGSIPGAQTTYSDSTIAAGTTYCYAVTAYGTNGNVAETAPSNLFLIAIPAAVPTLPAPNSLSGSYVQ